MATISNAERERRDALYDLGLKQCTTCGEPLPLARFSPQSDGYKGFAGSCKPCKNIRTADYRRRTPEHQAARQKRWRGENRPAWLAISRRRDVRVGWRRERAVIT